jgi:hypothetical protein
MSPLIAKRQAQQVATGNGLAPLSNGVALARRSVMPPRYQQRSFTAAATPIDITNRTEAQRIKKLRQPWQEEAWEYRDAIGELRYATTYLGNSARRMILVPSAYVEGELNPVPLMDIDGVPPSVLSAATDALDRLASGGSIALGGMLRDITENFEVAGECYLIGREVDGLETWEIRSISEVNVNSDGQIVLKDVDQQTSSGNGDPLQSSDFASRLWWPHPRRKAFADSPFKSILDVAEELLILSRDIRAAGRSRLANNGILLIPDSLTIVRADMDDDANDAEAGDPFFQELIAAAMAAIQDEGSASAVLPLVARGPAEALAAVRQLVIARQDPGNADKRQELITRMATGLDLPAEVLTGKANLNHWTSWQVSDDTFRHHIEPIVMVETDALTLGYYRPELKARQVPPEWLSRIVLWYDPTNLVTSPDRSEDARNAHDRMTISDEAYRNYTGFTDEDAPEVGEVLARMVRKGNLDSTLAAQIAKQWDDSLDITNVRSGERGYGRDGIDAIRPGPGERRQELPPEEESGPSALPASANEIGRAILELIQGGQQEMGGPGSGRYPKGSGTVKPASDKIGIGSRNDLDAGQATTAELSHARTTAKAKHAKLPTPTDADRARAEERHAKSKRAGGDDRPGSKQRKANRQALLKEFGNGKRAPCVCCGRNVTESTMSLDRIIPGSDGGTYRQGNLVPMDYDCNRVRSNVPFEEMMGEW